MFIKKWEDFFVLIFKYDLDQSSMFASTQSSLLHFQLKLLLTLIEPLVSQTQASQLDILITIVNTFCFN